jgi:hypothetical protein
VEGHEKSDVESEERSPQEGKQQVYCRAGAQLLQVPGVMVSPPMTMWARLQDIRRRALVHPVLQTSRSESEPTIQFREVGILVE